jgi:hypothetical protein
MFAWKIYKLSGRLLLPAFCWLLSFARPAFGIACCFLIIRASTAISFLHQFEWLLVTMLAFAAFSDVVVAAALTYHFATRRPQAVSV